MVISKTAWLEGMLVRPQHFQQQEAYFDYVIQDKAKMLQQYMWGIYHLAIDFSTLSFNKFSLTKCHGILPDGAWFEYNQTQTNELSVKLTKDSQANIIYLAVPEKNDSQLSEQKPATIEPRYLIKEFAVKDKYSSGSEIQEISIAELNLRLCTNEDNLANHYKIPIAKIKAIDEKKGIILDEEFLPPSINIFASTNFCNLFKATLELTERKQRQLITLLNSPAEQKLAQMTTTDGLLLLQIINRHAAVFNHLKETQQLHPEKFYQMLASYCAELATYTTEARNIPSFVAYDHGNPTLIFANLIKQLQFMLQSSINQQAINLPLTKQNNGIVKALLASHQLTQPGRFILLVKTDKNPQHIEAELNQQIKIAGASQIDNIINLQLPGLKLHTLPVAPAIIPYDQNACYFELDTKSPGWQQIISDRELCIYITKDYVDISLQLWLLPNWTKNSANAKSPAINSGITHHV